MRAHYSLWYKVRHDKKMKKGGQYSRISPEARILARSQFENYVFRAREYNPYLKFGFR